MAVESRHLNLFPSQVRRDFIPNVDNGNVFSGAPIGYGPLSGTTTATETVLSIYGSTPVKAAPMNSDSGLTYAAAIPVSRKRQRDVNNPLIHSSFPGAVQNQSTVNNRCGFGFGYTFLGEDISHQMQQQQIEIDRFVAQHTEKVRIEIEERRRRYSNRIAAVVEENVMKKLKAKEDEIEKIGKLNWALEERVKSLCVENQIWRDLAQTNEATANALRCNLEQVLAQDEQTQNQNQNRNRVVDNDVSAFVDDAQSCCGSNYEDSDPRMLAESSKVGVNNKNDRMCRSCGEEESCVLLLPCRHLCLCTVCGSSLHTCPVCFATKTASVHVNLSSS